jgi:hypothetical protein
MSEPDSYEFDWDSLVPRIINPAKVTLIETLLYMGQPLSASQIAKLHDHPELDLSRVSYHLSSLAAKKILVKVRQQQVRGAVEKFYFFPPPKRGGDRG